MNVRRIILVWLGLLLAAWCFAVNQDQPAPSSATSNAAPASVLFTNAPADSVAANTNRTEITSKQLRMETDKKIAYFDGDVLVLDPQFQLRANRLIVFLSTNSSGMEHAEAYDDVIIVQEEQKRRAYCQKAIYTAVDGKMVLTGTPRIEGEKGTTAGKTITIFRNNNILLVEGETKTILDLGLSQTNPPPPTATNAPPKPGSN